MKKLFCVFFLGMLLFTNIFAFSNTGVKESPFKESQKIYINPKFLTVNDEGIFLEIDANLFSLSQINADNEGIFILRAPVGTWECPACGGLILGSLERVNGAVGQKISSSIRIPAAPLELKFLIDRFLSLRPRLLFYRSFVPLSFPDQTQEIKGLQRRGSLPCRGLELSKYTETTSRFCFWQRESFRG